MSHQRNLAQDELRDRAREEIRNGRLPDSPPASIWAGPGSGLPCVVCGDPIAPAQVEYEVSGPSSTDSFRFHLPCHTQWQIECDVLPCDESTSTLQGV
jgi:hypothetical protein